MTGHARFRRGGPGYERFLYCNGCNYSKEWIHRTGQRCAGPAKRKKLRRPLKR